VIGGGRSDDDADGVVFGAEEYRTLRREIELPIVLQNLCLTLLAVLFTAVATLPRYRRYI
jgi:hypothetical protein